MKKEFNEGGKALIAYTAKICEQTSQRVREEMKEQGKR
jgi:hypothetical protein